MKYPPDTYVIDHTDLQSLLGGWMEEMPLIAPRERPDQPGFYYFDWLNRPEQWVMNYQSTTIPPKKAFFPPKDVLFQFQAATPLEITPAGETDPFLLAGVHPCDLAAIELLDQAYARPPAEMRWGAQRRRSTIVGVDCMPDEYCFCSSMGSSDARRGADLFLTRITEGVLIEVWTDAGGTLLKGVPKRIARGDHLKEAGQWRNEKSRRIRAALQAPGDEFALLLERGGLTPVWQEVAERCYSCGSCNTTCPTCFCFRLEDVLEADLCSGHRKRSWDSCQLLDFARVAGGHNFRENRWERVKHRWHRKFLYLYKSFGRPFCTGCGRCSRACTADINLVDVSNRLIDCGRRKMGHG